MFPLTSAQKCLCASEPSGLGAIVARHWEQAVWGDFSPSRLHRAAEIVAQRYPPVRLQLESGGQQRLAASFPLPLVRVSDACTLDEAAQRTLLASERDRMCTNEAGRLTNAWQIHVLRTNQETAVVTACFSRLFFDRCTIRQVLDALLRAYRAPTEELGAPLSIESFRAWSIAAQATDEERTEPTAETLPGPELPMIAAPSPPVAPRHTRVTIRIPGSVWADVKTNLLAEAREASLAALIGAGCGSALAMWAKQSRFAVQWWNEDRLLPGVPPESSGQFSRVSLATIDETENRAFSQRVVAMQRSLDEGTSAAQSVAFASATQASLPVVSFAPWFPRHPIQDTGPERSDQFVFVGASRPGVVLEFHSEETPERALILSIDFVREVFPPGVVESLAGALERWWHALGAGREAWKASPLEQAARLFPAAQARDRQAFNATQGPLTEDLLFSGFLRQLPQARNRTAIISPERKLTYGQLHGYAGRLALELQARGIRRNELVAVAMDKGWEQIAAAIGITLAGGAYLPVDIDLPAERIRFLVEYGAARVVVTQSTRASGLPLPAGVATIALDTLAPLEPDAPLPAANVAPDDLAYVIFTSGSTGMPKGVMIDHRGAVNTIADMNNRFGVRPDDRVLALSRLSFDLSVYDIFGLLAAGGTIVVPAPDLARDPAHWADLVRTHRVTIWNTVPALMQLLVDFAADRPDELGKSLRLVWMSGDWIPLPLPERIWRLLPGAQITSLGGATEASIWSILFPITAVDPDWRSIPYGRPMMNQTFHVLHENLAPCPDHVTGELFIGGVGVARGYWKDEYKTRARFITHPLSGDRLYRTGDLGRFLPDGYIEFLGRSDFQVKIRGFRIELGEIETALTAHHQVRIAVVVARGDTDSTRQLVAYVVAKDVAPAAAELQAFLRRRLPDYMVPAAFVLLERLPLTANGKVDVKALPAPATAAPDDPGRPPPAEPTNEIEEIILSLWRQILGIARVGIHDDFFSLGGTSLSGTRLVIRLREAFALPLPVQSLFENPTIHRLAAVIEASLLADVGQEERRTS